MNRATHHALINQRVSRSKGLPKAAAQPQQVWRTTQVQAPLPPLSGHDAAHKQLA
jgi:hypothetical protein